METGTLKKLFIVMYNMETNLITGVEHIIGVALHRLERGFANWKS